MKVMIPILVLISIMSQGFCGFAHKFRPLFSRLQNSFVRRAALVGTAYAGLRLTATTPATPAEQHPAELAKFDTQAPWIVPVEYQRTTEFTKLIMPLREHNSMYVLQTNDRGQCIRAVDLPFAFDNCVEESAEKQALLNPATLALIKQKTGTSKIKEISECDPLFFDVITEQLGYYISRKAQDEHDQRKAIEAPLFVSEISPQLLHECIRQNIHQRSQSKAILDHWDQVIKEQSETPGERIYGVPG